MEKSQKFYPSIKAFACWFLLSAWAAYGQPNCNAFLMQGDTLQYRACKLVQEQEGNYYQFDRRYHDVMDKALEICPYFAYAHREIGAPYVKSGNFLVWKKNMDNAVKYDRRGYLPVRASLRYKFFADYEGAIKDIDSLEKMGTYDIGYSSNGTYHLTVVKGLCLKSLGKIDEAIELIERQSEIEGDFGMYNYIHLGVLFMEKKDFDKALKSFEKQEQINNLAENQYYSALCHKKLKNIEKANDLFNMALKLYRSGQKMFDPYNALIDQIYLSDIERELLQNQPTE